MDALLDPLGKLASAVLALFLILTALGGPKGPPSSPSAQLSFPFMAEAAAPVRRLRRFYPVTTPFGPAGRVQG